MLKVLLALLSFVFVVGCSSLPPKTEAIHNALVTDAALRMAVDSCVAIGTDEKRLAQAEQALWWGRNREYVLGADHGLLDLNWALAKQSNEAHRAVLSMQVLELVQNDAASQYDEWFGDYVESEDCTKLFKTVNKEKLDLTKPKKQAEVLSEFYAERQQVSEDAATARSINSRYRKYGRSLFVVEKSLKEAGCSNPKIALLRNSWPIEVYDAVCSQKDYVIVKCEWGRCEVKR